jgi:hypothetical protein
LAISTNIPNRKLTKINLILLKNPNQLQESYTAKKFINSPIEANLTSNTTDSNIRQEENISNQSSHTKNTDI